jgi:hypothetical protein
LQLRTCGNHFDRARRHDASGLIQSTFTKITAGPVMTGGTTAKALQRQILPELRPNKSESASIATCADYEGDGFVHVCHP